MIGQTAHNRRRMLHGGAFALSSLATGLTGIRAQDAPEISRSAESIHFEPVINADRKRVYEALTDARQFNEVVKIAAATDPAISLEAAPTILSPNVGGVFSLFGGVIQGVQIELAPGTRMAPGAYLRICR